mgnify:CR=1 FL=1
MVLKILLFPDSRLRTVASEVEDVNAEIKTLCENMLETMYECGGCLLYTSDAADE